MHQDSLSVNSSTSSCGYQTAPSRSPSNGSISEKVAEDKDSDKEYSGTVVEKMPNNSVGNVNGGGVTGDSSICIDQHLKMLDNHVLMVTPPQDLSSVDSLKWVGSIQESITSHLSTILLSGNDEQVSLCVVVQSARLNNSDGG